MYFALLRTVRAITHRMNTVTETVYCRKYASMWVAYSSLHTPANIAFAVTKNHAAIWVK